MLSNGGYPCTTDTHEASILQLQLIKHIFDVTAARFPIRMMYRLSSTLLNLALQMTVQYSYMRQPRLFFGPVV